MRIAIGGISHETSTFAHTRTTVADFADGFGLFRGPEIINRFRGSNICTGGFIDGADKHGYELVPLLWGFAYPSGLITATDYAALKSEFLDRLQQAQREPGGIDGVLLDLHGAMVVEGIDDADADVIEGVRGVVGPAIPIVVTFDLHGNHSARRIAAASAIVGFDTYPHVDMAERGREAADLIVKILNREIQPMMAIERIPMFWGVENQITAHPPMKELMDYAHAVETRPGILCVSIATGFPWADVANMGASVMVVADRDQDLAEATARELRDWIWTRRETWRHRILTVDDALDQGEKLGKYPIILADHGDNTGGGAPGDSVEILATFLNRKLRDAVLLYIVDPEVVAQATAAGVGAVIDTAVGGKSDPIQGPPVKMRATVRALSQGDFTYDGPMYAGLTGNMGPSAWLEQDGVHVVVVTAHEQPLGPAFARTLGIDCESLKYIAVKSAVHFRSGFERFAGSIFNVDARATHTHDFRDLTYHKRPRPMFPLELT
ncbi:MAG: M81 family metallopeptidase [Planctomycetes bacterium]|nr:M81 family metallopeptidase [Planctomycetota bacterium]